MNTDNKFTPGEWKITEEMESLTIHTDKINIAEVLQMDIEYEEGKANALLIASSPDILDALIACREWFEKHSKDYEIGSPNCFIKAKAAIDKATKQ